MANSRTQPIVGVLLDSYGQYQIDIVESIKAVLEPEGITVVTVLGRELESHFYSYEGANHIYDLFAKADVQGFILASAMLSHNISLEKLQAFITQFSHLPIVSLGIDVPEITSVVLDNANGMNALMQHLIKVQGHKRFAFMQGFTNNTDSLQREHIFCSTLLENGLTVDPELITEGRFLAGDAFLAMDDLLKKRKDFDVVVAANDEMAYGCVQALIKHDLSVPHDIAVVGFDDREESASFLPPLTTVTQPLGQLGKTAAELLLKQLQGDKSRELKEVPTQLRIRQSCGLKLSSKQEVVRAKVTALAAAPSELKSLELRQARQAVLQALSRTDLTSLSSLPFETQIDLVDDFFLATENSTDVLLKQWQKQLQRSVLSFQELSWWRELLNAFEVCVLETLSDIRLLRQASKICVQLGKLVSDVHQSMQAQQQFEEIQSAIFQGRHHLDLTALTDLSDLMKGMVDFLKPNVERCFIALYEKTTKQITDTAVIKLALVKGQVLKISQEPFNSKELLPDTLKAVGFQGHLLLLPLCVGREQYGYMLIEPDLRKQFGYEPLANTFSIAIRNAQQLDALQTHTQTLEQVNDELAQVTKYDGLTGLPNWLLFQERLEQAFWQADQTENQVALLLLDLDGFKYINDTLGHSVGDQLLTVVAQRLKQRVRRTDTLARLGGDEFTIIMSDVRDSSAPIRLAEAVLEAFKQPFKLNQRSFHVTASIGVALYPEDGLDAETLTKHAETAMYHAKAKGKNRQHFFTGELNTQALEQLQLEQDLRQAMLNNDFHLVYQPRYSTKTRKVVGFEALLRWQRSDGLFISPAIFVPIAEQLGLMQKIGHFVLEQACKQAKFWKDAGASTCIAVNLSVHQLQQEDIVEEISSLLHKYDLESSWLELEITESAAMTDIEQNIDKLVIFRDMGIRIAIDDFGTAYSSLNYLKRLPVSTLKIDQSFIHDITEFSQESANSAIVKAIIAIGHILGFSVVAEGVETALQQQFLTDLNCNELQGFLLSRPVSPLAAFELLSLSEATWQPETQVA